MNNVLNTFIIPEEIKDDKVFSKYYQIYTQLKKELFFGNYSTGERFFSLRELRGKYGVDMQTIQSAVKLLIEDGFLCKKPASGIYVNDKKKRNSVLSMGNVWFCQLGWEKANPYYNGLLTALQSLAAKRKLNAIVCRDAGAADFKTWFQPETGDALILTGELEMDILKFLEQINFSRYMVIGNYEFPKNIPNVHTNIKDAVFRALKKASEAGRKRLSLIAGPEERRSTRDILDGVDAAAKAGLIEYAGGVLEFSEDGYSAMQKLKDNDFDSVLVTEPAFFGLCRYVFECGIKYPDELFVVRYGNNEDYDFYNDVTALAMSGDKNIIMTKVLDALFENGTKQIEIDIDIIEPHQKK